MSGRLGHEPGCGEAMTPALTHGGRRRRLATAWLALVAGLLLLYAVFGKGSAYISIGPLYLGELTLVGGVILVLCQGVSLAVFRSSAGIAMLLFMCWGAVGLAINLGEYGLLAVRDAVLWGYGAFAILMATALGRVDNPVDVLLRYLRVLAPLVVIGAPLVYLVGKIYEAQVPCWPGSGFHLLYNKPGDILVQLALVYAAMASGALTWRIFPWAGLWALAAMSIAPLNRGGSLAILLVAVLALMPRNANRRWPVAIVGMVVSLACLLAVSDLRIELNDFNRREISFQQIADNLVSLGGGPVQGNQQANAIWRIEWWQAIADALPQQGREWTGVGFGAHIARSFGVNYTPIEARSPHNVVMTIYARMGLIGLGLWVLMVVSWLVMVAKAMRRARAEGDRPRMALLTTLLLALPAFLLNGCVDVFLEGPVGGIWFWAIFGTGLAISRPKDSGRLMTEPTQEGPTTHDVVPS